MRLQSNGQLKKGGERNVDHPLLDLGDLAVVDATGIRHFAKAHTLLFSEFPQVFSKAFQDFLVCWRDHLLSVRLVNT